MPWRRCTKSSAALIRTGFLVAMAAAGLLLSSGSASAHANYERSEPADGAVLAESPDRVDMWTTQEMRRSEGLPVLTVVNESGDVLNEDGSTLDDADRTHVYAELPPALPDGRYTVIWHSLSDEDGEEAQGAFHYYVGEGPAGGAATPAPDETAEPTAPAAETPTTEPAATPTLEPSADADDGGDGLPVWALALGIIGGGVVGGGGGFLLARGRAGEA